MICDALYIHIPFCKSKCPYCDFYSVAADEALMDSYTAALLRALAQLPVRLAPLDSIYFGGGTPSVLGGSRLTKILDAIAAVAEVTATAEITVECNPCSALPATLKALHTTGVNRLSLGMQSSSDRLLRRLGRAHAADDVRRAIDEIHHAGFSHYSLDMMLATPGQTPDDIIADAAYCAQLGAEHVSAYLLKIEPNTPFARNNIAAACPDEDTQAALYLHAIDALADNGYSQYEISNFCRDGRLARHNYKYWDTQEYLGIGPAAHSFAQDRRFYFPSALSDFIAAPDPFALTIDDGAGGDMQEYIMLRLRLSEGLLWDTLATRFPLADPTALREKALPIVKGALAEMDNISLRLTPRGMLVSNAIISTLLL